MLVGVPISCIVDGATGSGVFGGVAGILGGLMCLMGVKSHTIRSLGGKYILNSRMTLGCPANNLDMRLMRPGKSILGSHYVSIKVC